MFRKRDLHRREIPPRGTVDMFEDVPFHSVKTYRAQVYPHLQYSLAITSALEETHDTPIE